jgi:hypothetical protein
MSREQQTETFTRLNALLNDVHVVTSERLNGFDCGESENTHTKNSIS